MKLSIKNIHGTKICIKIYVGQFKEFHDRKFVKSKLL